MSGERVRVGASSRRSFYPDADVDVSTIEPEIGLTQRAARECAPSAIADVIPDATSRWVAKPTGRVAIVVTYWDQVRSKTNSPVTPLYNQPAAASSASPRQS